TRLTSRRQAKAPTLPGGGSVLGFAAEVPAAEGDRGDDRDNNQRTAIESLAELLPLRAEIVADRNEAGHPHEAPGISIGREGAPFEFAHAGCQRCKVPDARDEVTEEQ